MLRIAKTLVNRVSYVAMLSVAAASQVAAQTTDSGAETVVVTGSRAAPRAATESSAPVSSYSGAEITGLGYANLSQALQYLDPAVNFAGSVDAGGAANARGPTLLGLSQDEVLVLVDGKRRGASSMIDFNATIGRGDVPVDISLIPEASISRVEVLTDGASAQYGSDAIAGVINIILRHEDTGGMLSSQAGITERGDGANADLSGWQGYAIGNGGSLTIAEDVNGAEPINRDTVDTRAGVAGRVTNQQGEDGYSNIDGSADLNLPLSGRWAAYGNVTVSQRIADNAIQFRLPTVDPAIYPAGFLPRTHLSLFDVQSTEGIKGGFMGWDVDVSDSFGFDRANFSVDHTANPSLGATSPTAFDAGGERYIQNLVDLGINKAFDLFSGVNVAAGLEHRYESYAIRSGEPGSYEGAGAYGFPGFNPPKPVDANRTAFSAYLDSEWMLFPQFRLGAAGRYENYSDFGSDTTGKLSAFYKPFEQFALRATASTGFRAPALQQEYYSTVTSQNNGGVLQNVGTFAVNDPVAIALGAQPLKPETSVNLSGGGVWTPMDDLTLTADVFRVDIKNRIALSETLSSPAVTAILLAHNITNAASARYFTNAANTKTTGLNMTADWKHEIDDWGLLNVSLGYNIADSGVTSLKTNPVIAAPDPANTLLGTGSIDFLTRAQPNNKLNAAVVWSTDRYTFTFDAVRFGSFRYVPSTAPVNQDQIFGAVAVFNLTADVRLTPTLTLSGGVQDLTDAYNDKVTAAKQGGTGLQYPEAGGVGFEGRQYFLRMTASL